MPGYYERKFAALLNTPTPPRPTTNSTTGKKSYDYYYQTWLDEETRAWLKSKAPQRRMSRWIDRQVAANALPECWVDTRPDELRQADRTRLEAELMPIWNEGSTRTHLRTNLAITHNTATILGNVSDTYGIVPQQYAVYRLFEGIRGPRLGTELSVNQKISAVLRAWAGGYITPRYFAREEVK